MTRTVDEGVVGSGMGLFLIGGHLLKILPQSSKGASQLSVCTLYMYYVWCTLFHPVVEICARVGQQFLSVVDNRKVWGI